MKDTVDVKDLLDASGLARFVKPRDVSDGYHSFSELYQHRYTLFCVLLTLIHREELDKFKAWKSRKHSDGTMFEGPEGYFIAGMSTVNDKMQITYHLESNYWELLDVPELEFAPPYDGHTPEDVLERLVNILV
jgi:hypothetical protein